ncbi:MAG: DUF11 domain-containing protein [Anaerolineae bacterium]|jgi:uncharacterized repeat protein (TIGR01451 family)|nr:DUF11 domain-containing protein [Anaerolineae bacterium]
MLSTPLFFLALLEVLGSEGSTISWQILSLPDKLANSEALIINIQDRETLYTFGGENSPSQVSSAVRYAVLSSDGAPEKWQAASSLPIPLRNHNVILFKNLVFVIGGKTNPGVFPGNLSYSNRVYCGLIDESGSISWEKNYSLLPNALGWLVFHASVASTEKIYVIGGWRTGGNSKDVWSMVPGDDCTDNINWNPEEQLNFGVSNHSATIATLESGEQVIYVVGGYQDPLLSNSVQAAKIDLDGNLGKWETISVLEDMPGVQRHKVITTEGFIYVIGGSPSLKIDNSLNTIFRAKIDQNGDLGPWENLNNLPYSVHSHAVAVSNSGQIYIVGGDADQDDFYQELLYSPLVWFTKHAEPEVEVFAGDEITYTINFTNNGLRPLTNLIITDEIPTNTILIRPEYEPDTRILTRVIPTLGLNETGSISFTVQVVPPLTAVPPALSTATPTPTVPSINSGLTCSTGWSGGGGTPRPTCTPTATPIPVETTPTPSATSTPVTTRIFGLTPIPVINQAWMCEANWCIQSNPVFNAPYHFYLPIVLR